MSGKRAKKSHLWDRHPDDWYVEPEWCADRLFEVEGFTRELIIVDPSCGIGRVIDAAGRAGYMASGYDLVQRRPDVHQADFFASDLPLATQIVSNPPFKHCRADSDFRYVRQALKRVRPGGKVALLLPVTFPHNAQASAYLKTTPLKREWKLVPRPSMPPGPVVEAGIKPGNGREDFSWFIWEDGYAGAPTFGWLDRDGAADG